MRISNPFIECCRLLRQRAREAAANPYDDAYCWSDVAYGLEQMRSILREADGSEAKAGRRAVLNDLRRRCIAASGRNASPAAVQDLLKAVDAFLRDAMDTELAADGAKIHAQNVRDHAAKLGAAGADGGQAEAWAGSSEDEDEAEDDVSFTRDVLGVTDDESQAPRKKKLSDREIAERRARLDNYAKYGEAGNDMIYGQRIRGQASTPAARFFEREWKGSAIRRPAEEGPAARTFRRYWGSDGAQRLRERAITARAGADATAAQHFKAGWSAR